MILVSNCSKCRPNNSTNIQQYCTVTCTVVNLFAIQVSVCTQNCHSPSFIDKFIDYSSWITNLLLDVLVCGITLYLYLLFAFWLALRAHQNMAQLIKYTVILHTKTSYKIYVYHPSEPISLLHGRSSGSLDDIMLEDDTDLHKELDDFFGPEAEVSEQFLWINYDEKTKTKTKTV